MFELKNTLENKILKNLAIHQALGTLKLFEIVRTDDNPEEFIHFQHALGVLMRKGIIDVVSDKTDTMQVARMKQILH